jgi:hypothetical protein
MYLFCNSRIHVITLYSGYVCVYYASMLRCWHLVWILVRTDHPCLGVRCHTLSWSRAKRRPPPNPLLHRHSYHSDVASVSSPRYPEAMERVRATFVLLTIQTSSLKNKRATTISISPLLDEQHRSTRPSSIHRRCASRATVCHGRHPVVDSMARATPTPSPSTPCSSDSSTNATAAGKFLPPLIDPPSQSAPFPMALPSG